MSNKYYSKGVSFNLSDPDQISLLEHANKRENFSGYIKRLIQKDKDTDKTSDMNNELTNYQKNPPSENLKSESNFNENLMSGLL